MQESERSQRFERVLNEEIDLIATARRTVGIDAGDTERLTGEDGAYSRAHRASLIGLALSGGGIRSATFNLGALQALAKHRLLARMDYLSTVSGGGYIGSWLSAWIHRHAEGVLGVQNAIREGLAGRGNEPGEVSWLRDYSNYLVVRLGFFSGDSWATIAIYLRNLCLNITLIVACLGLAVLLPRVLMLALGRVPEHWFGPISFGLLVIVVAFIAVNLQRTDRVRDWARGHFGVLTFIVLPGTIAALMLAHALLVDLPGAVHVRALLDKFWPKGMPLHLASWVVTGAILYTVPWVVGAVLSAAFPAQNTRPRFRWIYVLTWAPLAGALLGVLCYAYSRFAVDVVNAHPLAGFWLVTGFGSAALVAIFCVSLVLHIGLVSRGFSEDVREWWARLGGWATLATLLWVSGFALVIYAPPVVGMLGDWIAALGVGWIGSTLMGVLLGRSAATGVKSSRVLERITVALPFVFVAGLVIAVAVGMHALLVPAGGICDFSESLEDLDYTQTVFEQKTETAYCELALADKTVLAQWIAALGLLAFVLQLRVDVNVFSLGPLYRNRLLRCYLGASRRNAREPHPFTGFDRNDDLRLADLAGVAGEAGPTRCQRPYPIINTAINLTSGQKLAWQSRKAAAFAFTPLYCGYQMPEEGSTRWVGRYCLTREYVSGPRHENLRGSIALSNAVTISGAAASPNAGYHSAPSVAFLLTVFNVRLGSWFQNPRRPEIWRQPGPAHALRPLLSELFGLSNDRSDFVYLSDGGHFENLGIYELVRRRCRFIIACDASCDPDMTFEDLGNAIRKCRIDFDVDIEIDTRALMPLAGSGHSVHHCALGLVRYDRADPRERTGYLLYVKASMSGDEPQDVEQYRSHHPRFPHQSTTDQFFDEAQFESYRSLGLHIMDTVLATSVANARSATAGVGDRSYEIDLERLFKELRQRYPGRDLGEDPHRRAAAVSRSAAQPRVAVPRVHGRRDFMRAALAARRRARAARRVLPVRLDHPAHGERVPRPEPRGMARPSGQPGLDEHVPALCGRRDAAGHVGDHRIDLRRAFPELLRAALPPRRVWDGDDARRHRSQRARRRRHGERRTAGARDRRSPRRGWRTRGGRSRPALQPERAPRAVAAARAELVRLSGRLCGRARRKSAVGATDAALLSRRRSPAADGTGLARDARAAADLPGPRARSRHARAGAAHRDFGSRPRALRSPVPRGEARARERAQRVSRTAAAVALPASLLPVAATGIEAAIR
jgi:predicted acylesterase/phospholipase RssA